MGKGMLEEKSWKEFRETGLVWFVNQSLQLFGWSLVMNLDDDGNVVSVYPSRTKFRGFSNNINSDGYSKVSKYLKENIDELEKEASE